MWYNRNNDIIIDKLDDLLVIADSNEFGEENTTLQSWLMCEAFEYRFDPETNRNLRLAAMIISRIERKKN